MLEQTVFVLGHYLALGMAFFTLFLWTVLWILHGVGLFYGKYRLHRRVELSPQLNEESLPGVSILKPLCTTNDPNLFHNLQTFFTLDYPKYEIIFCIQEVDDDLLRIYVDTLRSKFPSVECQVFYGGEEVGVNPKVNNMQPGFLAARHELILVSDSGIRMREDALTDMVACMTPDVGLVHQLPYVCDRSGVPATLEKIYFGTSHARMYLAANFFGVNCATGMSALMRKQLIDNAGGMAAFGCYLAEDYFMAKAIMSQGKKLRISSFPALQNPGDVTITLFQNRISRWSKLRTAMMPHFLLLEPLTECMLLGMLASWAVYLLLTWEPLPFFLVHVLVWFLMDWALLHIVQNGSLPFNKFEFVVIWLFRELSSPYIFVLAQMDQSIRWRDKAFYLKWGGVAQVLEPSSKA